MSTEYLIELSLGYGTAAPAAVQDFFGRIRSRRPPYEIEITLETYWPEAEAQLAQILDKHANLFLSLDAMEVSASGLTLVWQGYGEGEWFLERVILLCQSVGMAVIKGRAVGDEGEYRCVVRDGEIEFHYDEA